MKIQTLLRIAACGFLPMAFAAEKTFDFKDPKGVNNVTFHLDAPLEQISGSANGISGTVTVDTDDLSTAKGSIVVSTDSMHVPNPMMNGHMHSDKWLDAAKYPEIKFELTKVAKVEKDGDKGTADVTGTLTLHGVSKELTVPVMVTYLPGKLGDRVPNAKGDLLVIRADFTIKRGDFGIQPGQNEDKVSNDIKISLAVAGAAAE